ncbi:MAG: beta-lactamase class [Sphingomonadales bacterium]|jgi:beta-lactamase class A|nr:beta-lactamase class [Sphingomonadales bacterium]
MRIAGLLAALLAFVAQPAWADDSPRLRSLEQRLAAMVAENPGEYGIAALDLASGETISFNGQKAFPMASTMKIAVAAAYLTEVDAGRRTLDEPVAGTSALKLMDAMITHSDNRATDLLMATLGGPGAVNGWLRGHGLNDIRVDRTIAQLLRDPRDLRDVRDSSTPIAMLGLLRLIDSDGPLTSQSRYLLRDMMRRCATGSNRIRGILPPGATVEHKTGTLTGYTGDVGFLTTPSGRRIAVAFFARGGSNRPGVIATAARAIYDALAAENSATTLTSPAAANPLATAADRGSN